MNVMLLIARMLLAGVFSIAGVARLRCVLVGSEVSVKKFQASVVIPTLSIQVGPGEFQSDDLWNIPLGGFGRKTQAKVIGDIK